MKNFILAAVGGTALAMCASPVQASGCPGPACQQPGVVGQGGVFHKLFARQPLPAFQAAPWYLYWPYNAHFMTPAPLPGAPFGTPGVGQPMVNPYFPGYGR